MDLIKPWTQAELIKLTWEQVKPIWDTHLWPGRDSEPVTSMMYLGGYDMLYKEEEPVFLGVGSGREIVAVNSYVRTEGTQYRSRGLWVHPSMRHQGLSYNMLEHMLDWIKADGGTMVWTMPRENALHAYQRVGFVRTSDWFDADWGRNCYAMASLRSINDIAEDATYIKAGRSTFYVHNLMPRVESGDITTEEARLIMRELADDEQVRWG